MNKEEVLKFITDKDSVTFVEIENRWPNLKEADGGLVWELQPNLVAWSGWSKASYEMLRDLVKAGLIDMQSTQKLTYMIDGGGLNFPIAKKLKPYKSFRWLPIVFNRPTKSQSSLE